MTCDDLHNRLERMNVESSDQAKQRSATARPGAGQFITTPLKLFFAAFWGQRQCRLGLNGFIASWLAALQGMALQMKIWHLQHDPGNGPDGAGENRP
jgi:hypothetical protein